jgi:hypothetical protein
MLYPGLFLLVWFVDCGVTGSGVWSGHGYQGTYAPSQVAEDVLYGCYFYSLFYY